MDLQYACFHFTSAPSERAIQGFAEACYRFSPQIGTLEQKALWVEVGRSAKLFTAAGFRMRTEALLQKFSLKANFGLAGSAILAWALARFEVSAQSELPLSSLRFFADPLGHDAIAERGMNKLLLALEAVGVRSLDGFLQIPAGQLASRFGSVALLARHRLNGELDLPWPTWRPDPIVSESRVLNYEEWTSDREAILFLLKPLLERAFSRLWARGRKLSRLELRFKLDGSPSRPKPVRLMDLPLMMPQGTARALLPILSERIQRETEKKPFSALVIEIGLRVLEHAPGYEAQRNFISQKEEQEEEWSAALAQLSESVAGKGRVFKAKLKEERLPEKAWDRVGFQEPVGPQLELEQILPLRPSRVLRRPERVEMSGLQVLIRKNPYQIREWSRPEILSEWLGTPVKRKYFRVTLEKASPIWVFSDEQDQFFLHGYFE